jgi:trimethylamine:corrinoid methyltransferase-like protein
MSADELSQGGDAKMPEKVFPPDEKRDFTGTTSAPKESDPRGRGEADNSVAVPDLLNTSLEKTVRFHTWLDCIGLEIVRKGDLAAKSREIEAARSRIAALEKALGLSISDADKAESDLAAARSEIVAAAKKIEKLPRSEK